MGSTTRGTSVSGAATAARYSGHATRRHSVVDLHAVPPCLLRPVEGGVGMLEGDGGDLVRLVDRHARGQVARAASPATGR